MDALNGFTKVPPPLIVDQVPEPTDIGVAATLAGPANVHIVKFGPAIDGLANWSTLTARLALVAGQTPAIAIRHTSVFVPRPSVACEFAAAVFAIVAAPGGTNDQVPAPREGTFPVKLVVGLLIQSVCVKPTLACVGA